MESARKFKIIVNSKECGTCSGATPSAVAKKVVKKLCGSSSKVVRFNLKECKRGCERMFGPYQGRMEKLDRPFKRDGKTITHRVVCGKVRKMRGGRELVASDFNRPELLSKFNDKMIDGKPHVFFGGHYEDPFKFVVFNRELYKLGDKKSIGIRVLQGNDVKPIEKLENLRLELQYELSRLGELLKDKREYKTIRYFLEKYDILQNITKQTFENSSEPYVEYSTKYKSRYNPKIKLVEYNKYFILFFDFLESKPRYCLVFTNNDFINNDFIVIYIENGDIESIENLFGEISDHSYIYLLANNDNVPVFIKDKLNRLIEKEKEIREKIIKYYSKFDLKNIESQYDTLFNILKETFSDIHNEKIFKRLIHQEETFIKNQVKKSINDHMKNNRNKTVSNVYKGINQNETNNYQRFFNEGKRLANKEKEEEAEKAERKAKKNAEEARRKAERNAEEARRKAERNAERNARRKEEDERKAEEAREKKEEAEFMNSISSKIQFNKNKYKKNEKNRNIVKNFIKECYDKDNNFMSKLLMWYCNELSEIYRILSESFQKRSIKKNEFNTQLIQNLTEEKLYESESFPKNIKLLNYRNQYEELKAFASFFINILNDFMKDCYLTCYNLIYSLKEPLKKSPEKLFDTLKDIIITALEELGIDYIKELQIPVSTVNNRQQQQQPNNNGNGNNE